MMKKVLAAAMALGAAAAVTLLVMTAGDTERASAGATPAAPVISPAVVGTTVEVSAGAALDAFTGFNLDLLAQASAGVTITAIGSNSTNSILIDGGDPGSIFCTGSDQIADVQRVFACTSLTGFATTGPGLLGTFTFTTTGDGCITASLVEEEGNSVTDTYTIGQATGEPQANVVVTTPVTVLIGTGTLADCPGVATPTPTATATATAITVLTTPTPPTTATPCGANGCPTPGSIATSTNTPEPTATVGEPAPGGTTAPPPPPPGGSPGAGGTGPTRVGITLPDTGDGSGGGGAPLLWAMLAVAAIALGGGTLAVARRRR